MKDVEAAARSVEVSKGLTALQAQVSVFADQALEVTRDAGVIARLAAALTGQGKVDALMLRHVAQNVGLGWPELEARYLPRLVDLGWGVANRDGRRLSSFSESIPDASSVLRQVGQDWTNGDPSDHDIGTVEGLHRVSKRPHEVTALKDSLGLKSETMSDIVKYGSEATYFLETDSYLWSPLYWHTNPDGVSRILRGSDESRLGLIEDLVGAISKTPGLSNEKLSGPAGVLEDAVKAGLLPTVTVHARGADYRYHFAPNAAYSGDPAGDLFEKARTIVACIRHGAWHSPVTRIKYPTLVLNRMMDGTLGAHSHQLQQYAPLVTQGIATIEERAPGRYSASIVDTPDNRRAVDLARHLLRATDADALATTSPEFVALFGTGYIEGSAKARIRASQARVQAIDEMEELRRAIRGRRR